MKKFKPLECMMITKICNCCNQEKPISKFKKAKRIKSGYTNICKSCSSKKNKIYYEQNIIEIKQKTKKYRIEKKCDILLSKIKQRCNNPNSNNYIYYGMKGIKCLITVEEIKELWERDEAFNMKKPSIDRIDNDGNYEYSNCRFIELNENIAKDKRKPVLQYDLKGNFIREWGSMLEAEYALKIYGIYYVVYNKRKTAGGFIWKLKK